MRSRLHTFVLLLGVALAPGCAVLDGLGGERQEASDGPGSGPGGGTTNGPDAGATTIGPDAQAAPRRLHVRLLPAVSPACQPDLSVADFVIEEVAPDGSFDVITDPFRIVGKADPMRFGGVVLCSDVVGLEMEAPFDGAIYRGMYVQQPEGNSGTLEVVPLQ
jgi:hypothetical protein